MYFNFLVDFTAFPLISVSFGIRSLYRMKFKYFFIVIVSAFLPLNIINSSKSIKAFSVAA